MEYMVSVLWWVVLAGGILIFSAVKKSRNRKAAESGEDLETVRRAVERAAGRVEASLGDKKGHAIIQLYVDAVNLRKSRWFPLNILQRERCEEFYHFITALACQVADVNPDVDAMLAAVQCWAFFKYF